MNSLMRRCVCGVGISPRRRLCKECLDIYGSDSDEWPEWLRWQISDIQREIDHDRRHDEVEITAGDLLSSKPAFALRGCRTETHLYQDRDKY